MSQSGPGGRDHVSNAVREELPPGQGSRGATSHSFQDALGQVTQRDQASMSSSVL